MLARFFFSRLPFTTSILHCMQIIILHSLQDNRRRTSSQKLYCTIIGYLNYTLHIYVKPTFLISFSLCEGSNLSGRSLRLRSIQLMSSSYDDSMLSQLPHTYMWRSIGWSASMVSTQFVLSIIQCSECCNKYAHSFHKLSPTFTRLKASQPTSFRGRHLSWGLSIYHPPYEGKIVLQ